MAALGLAVALAVAMWNLSSLKSRNATLRASVVAFERTIEQRNEALAVHRAHIERMQAEGQAQQERLNQLRELGGRDAPLSDHLRGASGILWPE